MSLTEVNVNFMTYSLLDRATFISKNGLYPLVNMGMKLEISCGMTNLPTKASLSLI